MKPTDLKHTLKDIAFSCFTKVRTIHGTITLVLGLKALQKYVHKLSNFLI